MAKLRGLAKGCGLIVAGAAALIAVALIALFVWAHFVGPPTPLPAPKTAAERVARNLKVFDAVWDDINRHYYDRTFHGQNWEAAKRAFRPKAAAAVSDAQLYLVVLNPMLAKLSDSHTRVTPAGKADFWAPVGPAPPNMTCPEPRAADVLGFWPGRSWARDGWQVVADFRRGGPAERQGFEPGLSFALRRYGFSDCGPIHTTLDIWPAGNGPKHQASYIVDRVPPEPSHEAHSLTDGVEVLRFNRFEFADAGWLLTRLKSAPAAGVILDLRHNNGGAVFVLQAIAGVLEGPSRALGVTIDGKGRHALRSRRLNLIDQFAVSDFKTPTSFQYRGPLVVLVGPASVSAAEILARSLQVRGRAVLVGERTAGAVLVAHNYDLPDGGVVQLPVQDFEDPQGQRLENRGVAPDIFARQTLAAIRSDRDLVVEAADAAMRRASKV